MAGGTMKGGRPAGGKPTMTGGKPASGRPTERTTGSGNTQRTRTTNSPERTYGRGVTRTSRGR